jgi:ABC-type oligopeptide transport system substrate-binding subunit
MALLTGCSRLFGPAPVLRVAVPTEPVSLDWVSTDAASPGVLKQIQRGLVRAEPEGPVPDLSEGWSLDAEGTRYTFLLTKERWSDGVELNAGDFVYAFRRHLTPGTQTPWTPALLQIAGARDFHSGKHSDFSKVGIRARGASILEIALGKKDDGFVAKLATAALGPQREDIAQLHPTEFAQPLYLRAIGPYQPLEWKRGESLLLVANSYSSLKPAIAKVRLIFADATKAARAWERGELDVVVGTGSTRPGPKVAELPVDAHGFPIFAQARWK